MQSKCQRPARKLCLNPTSMFSRIRSLPPMGRFRPNSSRETCSEREVEDKPCSSQTSKRLDRNAQLFQVVKGGHRETGQDNMMGTRWTGTTERTGHQWQAQAQLLVSRMAIRNAGSRNWTDHLFLCWNCLVRWTSELTITLNYASCFLKSSFL